MPHCFVRQPNGLYAIWSSITDSFLGLNFPPDQAVSYEMAGDHCGYPGGAVALRADLESEFDHIKHSGRAWDWAPDWNDAVSYLESAGRGDALAKIDDLALPRRMERQVDIVRAEVYWKNYWRGEYERLESEIVMLRYQLKREKDKS